MARTRVRFSYPPELVSEPLIYNLGRDFSIVTNIQRASVTEEKAWVLLELVGAEDDLRRGIDWAKSVGVRVDPIGGDIIEP